MGDRWSQVSEGQDPVKTDMTLTVPKDVVLTLAVEALSKKVDALSNQLKDHVDDRNFLKKRIEDLEKRLSERAARQGDHEKTADSRWQAHEKLVREVNDLKDWFVSTVGERTARINRLEEDAGITPVGAYSRPSLDIEGRPWTNGKLEAALIVLAYNAERPEVKSVDRSVFMDAFQRLWPYSRKDVYPTELGDTIRKWAKK